MENHSRLLKLQNILLNTMVMKESVTLRYTIIKRKITISALNVLIRHLRKIRETSSSFSKRLTSEIISDTITEKLQNLYLKI